MAARPPPNSDCRRQPQTLSPNINVTRAGNVTPALYNSLMTTTTVSIKEVKSKLLDEPIDDVAILPDPDRIGTAEYRAVYLLVQRAIDDAYLNCDTGDEFVDLLLSELYELADTAVEQYQRIAAAFGKEQRLRLVSRELYRAGWIAHPPAPD